MQLLIQDEPRSPSPTAVDNLDIIVSDDPSGGLETRLLHAVDGRHLPVADLARISGRSGIHTWIPQTDPELEAHRTLRLRLGVLHTLIYRHDSVRDNDSIRRQFTAMVEQMSDVHRLNAIAQNREWTYEADLIIRQGAIHNKRRF